MMLCFRGLQVWVFVCCGWLGAVQLSGTAWAQHTLPSAEAFSHRPLAEALIALQNKTGIDLTYDPEVVARKWTPAVIPRATSPEAMLEALLEGTGLSFYRLSSGTYAIQDVRSLYALRGSLEGYVLDEATGTPLPRANVLLADASPRGTATNTGGRFSFPPLPPGRYVLEVSHIGYQTAVDTVQVRPDERTELRVALQARPVPVTVTPIVVEDYKGIEDLHALGNSTAREELTQFNALGTADAVRSMNSMTGIRVGDAMADVHIQGGEAGEHQFRLDGVPVFEPVHLRGLLGAFNPFALERITVNKAGFSVAEGSQLAGVIDAEHALSGGHPLDVQVDPLSLNARMNVHAGSPDGIQGQFMAAYRTSVWDLYSPAHIDSLLLDWNTPDQFLMRVSLLNPKLIALRELNPFQFRKIVPELDSIPPPDVPDLGFSDVHAAGRLRFGRENALYASYYRGDNRLDSRRLVTAFDTTLQDLPNPDRYRWSNENAQVRWTSLLGSTTLLSTRLSSSLYNLEHDYSALANQEARQLSFVEGYFVFDLTPADDGNRIREVSLESTLDHTHAGGQFQMGLEATRSTHRFVISDAFTRPIVHDASSWRLAGFVEEQLTLLPRLKITGGTRLTYLEPRATVYAEPRLDLRYTAPDTPFGILSVRGATGVYRQFLNQFDISSISPSALFPAIRFWMPVDSSIAPPKAYHFAGDVMVQPSHAWTFHLEGYYKKQPHLLRIDYPSLWRRNADEAEDVITSQGQFLKSSEGYAYGAAFVVKRTGEKLRTSVRYEYNMARRQYAFQDTVRYETVPWNEPHHLEFALDWTPHPRLVATVRWRGGWQRAWGFRRAYYDFLGTDATQRSVYGDFDFRLPEEHTLPTFSQLDLGTAYTQPLGPAAVQVRLDVLNATNRNNVEDRSLLQQGADDEALFSAQDRLLLSRTFSLAVRLQW